MWILKIEKQPIRNRGFSTWPTLIISVPNHIAVDNKQGSPLSLFVLFFSNIKNSKEGTKEREREREERNNGKLN